MKSPKEVALDLYYQDEKVDHFRVYFNCVNKFNSMNQFLPTFPYFNY